MRIGWFGWVFLVGCTRTPAGKSIPTAEELARESPPETCTLQQWEDGDTPYVDCPSGKTPVRLIGIDTPESGFDKNSRRRGHYQEKLWGVSVDRVFDCGKEATRRANELCPAGESIQVIGRRLDKYNRRLGYVLCKSGNVNQRLLEEGYAGRYPFPSPPEKPARCSEAAAQPDSTAKAKQ